MTGNNEFVLNADTMRNALQDYFVKKVFDASQIVTIKSIEPEEGKGYQAGWSYRVQVECVNEPEKPQ